MNLLTVIRKSRYVYIFPTIVIKLPTTHKNEKNLYAYSVSTFFS